MKYENKQMTSGKSIDPFLAYADWIAEANRLAREAAHRALRPLVERFTEEALEIQRKNDE